jgi:hypothetical protein
MARPKLFFSKSPLLAHDAQPAIERDYRIYAGYHRTCSGDFMGELKVVRTTDGKILFPFDGAPEIGPFQSAAEAREAARSKGDETVAADLSNPE